MSQVVLGALDVKRKGREITKRDRHTVSTIVLERSVGLVSLYIIDVRYLL
jgi:hypothetical protein